MHVSRTKPCHPSVIQEKDFVRDIQFLGDSLVKNSKIKWYSPHVDVNINSVNIKPIQESQKLNQVSHDSTISMVANIDSEEEKIISINIWLSFTSLFFSFLLLLWKNQVNG